MPGLRTALVLLLVTGAVWAYYAPVSILPDVELNCWRGPLENCFNNANSRHRVLGALGLLVTAAWLAWSGYRARVR